MKHASKILLLFITVLLASACVDQPKRVGQAQALQIAWKALDPNTLSHDSESWEISEARKALGGEVVSVFAAPQRENCPGPRQPENQPIKNTSEYWYFKFLPHPQVWRPQKDTASPNMVPIVPEPIIKEAYFLIDMFTGEVAARKLTCQDAP